MFPTFRVYFRRKLQFFDVFLHDVLPETFQKGGGGRWGYFICNGRYKRKGKFGEIHLVESRVRPDLVSHELDHLRMAWLFARWIIITPNNEEKFCKFGDELIRNFYREYHKYQQRIDSTNKKGSIRNRRTK